MSRSRPHSDLARLLNQSETPLYAVDEQGEIVFVNQAAVQWAGHPAEELVGQACRYHGGVDVSGPLAAACQLCPPPVAMTGVETTAEVSLPAADGKLVRRPVRFVPIRSAEQEVLGILAIGGSILADSTKNDLASQPESSAAAALHEQLGRILHRYRQHYQADRLVGQSPAMVRVRAQVALAAATLANVLIVGPPGSGREHVARTLHSAGPQRGSEPLVPLACALVGGELLRTTLAALLHRDSASPAHATLLLNDVDQLAAEFQADLPSLLNAAEGKVRIIATSSAPLLQLAQRGEFLTLPAHQLSTMVIELPPLTGRLTDLPLLAQMFLERSNARGSKQVGGFTEDALDLLSAYPWSKDLDELEQIVTEAHRQCAGTDITAADLPDSVRQARQAVAYAAKQEEVVDLEEFLSRIELELIQRAMTRAKGNKTKAAQLLGMNRPRLYRRLVQLGLAEEDETEA